MGSGGSESSSGTQQNFIRYAPYIETKHKSFLNQIQTYRNLLRNDSPYDGFSAPNLDLYFFGTGATIRSFNALFEQYELLLTDFDLDASYETIFDRTVNSQQVKNLVTAEGTRLSDDLKSDSLPRLQTGARDLNAVNSTTFVIAKALLEESRLKALSKYSAELKYHMIPIVSDRWKTKLEWRKNEMLVYQEMMKLVLLAKIDFTNQEYEIKAKDTLWPFTVLDHERAALGALQGARSSETVSGEGGPSTGQKVLGGALSGAAMGATVGGVPGAAIGGVLGGIGGLL